MLLKWCKATKGKIFTAVIHYSQNTTSLKHFIPRLQTRMNTRIMSTQQVCPSS